LHASEKSRLNLFQESFGIGRIFLVTFSLPAVLPIRGVLIGPLEFSHQTVDELISGVLLDGGVCFLQVSARHVVPGAVTHVAYLSQ